MRWKVSSFGSLIDWAGNFAWSFFFRAYCSRFTSSRSCSCVVAVAAGLKQIWIAGHVGKSKKKDPWKLGRAANDAQYANGAS
jgi:hypothetical protein